MEAAIVLLKIVRFIFNIDQNPYCQRICCFVHCEAHGTFSGVFGLFTPDQSGPEYIRGIKKPISVGIPHR
jgi:hypothetical protein